MLQLPATASLAWDPEAAAVFAKGADPPRKFDSSPLVRSLLASPQGHGTAVVVNEFGAVGIDDALLRASSDEVTLLGNGCLCCTTRTDLQIALRRLVAETRLDVDDLVDQHVRISFEFKLCLAGSECVSYRGPRREDPLSGLAHDRPVQREARVLGGQRPAPGSGQGCAQQEQGVGRPGSDHHLLGTGLNCTGAREVVGERRAQFDPPPDVAVAEGVGRRA